MEELIPLAENIARLLIERKQTIAVAEPSAGGLISAALLSVPGASAYFIGGSVVYTRTPRTALLQIPESALENIRASTEAYALLLARAARDRLGTTWVIAETGATGPTGNRYGDAAGHACLAVCGPVESSSASQTRDTSDITSRRVPVDGRTAAKPSDVFGGNAHHGIALGKRNSCTQGGERQRSHFSPEASGAQVSGYFRM